MHCCDHLCRRSPYYEFNALTIGLDITQKYYFKWFITQRIVISITMSATAMRGDEGHPNPRSPYAVTLAGSGISGISDPLWFDLIYSVRCDVTSKMRSTKKFWALDALNANIGCNLSSLSSDPMPFEPLFIFSVNTREKTSVDWKRISAKIGLNLVIILLN